jgi:uncharacterized damage-inducible protein DinB
VTQPHPTSPDALRYPLGRFSRPASLTAEERDTALRTLEHLPGELRRTMAGLSDEQIDTPYREGGWSLRQVVHHVADSHLNAYARVRLALTEDWPAVTRYSESAWAELPDARTAPVEPSLQMIDAVHTRWTALLRALPQEAWSRGYRHPESGEQTVAQVVALYAWHGRHHLAHATGLRERRGW